MDYSQAIPEYVPIKFEEKLEAFRPLVFPKTYVDTNDSSIVQALDASFNDIDAIIMCVSKGNISSKRKTIRGRNLFVYSLTVALPSGQNVYVTWFSKPNEVYDHVITQRPFLLKGKISLFNNNFSIKSPVFISQDYFGKAFPVYQMGERDRSNFITQYQVSRWASSNLGFYIDSSLVFLRQTLGLCNQQQEANLLEFLSLRFLSIPEILSNIHFPTSDANGRAAQEAMDILNTYHLVVQAKKTYRIEDNPFSSISVDEKVINYALKRIDYGEGLTITSEQEGVVRDLLVDLRGMKPLNGLLTADVGFGKSTIITSVAAILAYSNRKVGILLPNILLVQQIIDDIHAFWPEIKMQKITQKTGKINPLANIYVGTQALNTRVNKNKDLDLDLLIVDEEQRFGELQKKVAKSHRTNQISSTATCLPKTMAKVMMGEIKTYQLTKPFTEKSIKTQIYDASQNRSLFSELESIISHGGQIMVVYPEVSGRGKSKSTQNVLEAFELWKAKFGTDVGMVYGALTDEEKEQAINSYKEQSTKILICTSLIEVGVNSKNTRGVVVIEPDRYGLSTLHQFRGRLARNGGRGKFFMYLGRFLDDYEDKTLRRLNVLVNENNGWNIAEQDLILRGPGSLSNIEVEQGGDIKGSLLPERKLKIEDFKFVASLITQQGEVSE